MAFTKGKSGPGDDEEEDMEESPDSSEESASPEETSAMRMFEKATDAAGKAAAMKLFMKACGY